MANLNQLKYQYHMNSVLQNITSTRYLVVENQLYNLVMTLCLPAARALVKRHKSHSDNDSECTCAKYGHQHKHWLSHLVMRIYTSLASSVKEANISSIHYLPKLETP